MSRALVLAALLASGAAAQAQSLGRLFYTPEQRQALTALRLRGAPSPDAAHGAPAMPLDAGAMPAGGSVGGDPAVAMPSTDAVGAVGAGTAAPREAILNGVLERPGSRVAWLAGVAVEDGARWMGYRVEVGTRGVRLHRVGQPQRLLGVGQRLDLATGEVRGALAPDAVRRSGP